MVRMDLFRSEEMNKVQLIIPSDSAHYTMTYLAEIGQLQFKDVSVFFDLSVPPAAILICLHDIVVYSPLWSHIHKHILSNSIDLYLLGDS